MLDRSTANEIDVNDEKKREVTREEETRE